MDNIHVIKALGNIESKMHNLQDGDFLVITVPNHIPAQVIERFSQQLQPRVDEIRQHTGRKFGVLLFVEGVTVEVVRHDREYTRLKTELEELKQTVAKLINTKEKR